MLGKIIRACKIIVKEGLPTYLYLFFANRREKRSEKQKYRRWRKLHEKKVVSTEADAALFSVVSLGEEKRTLREILEGMKEAYAVFLEEGAKLDPQAFYWLKRAVEENGDPMLLYSDGDSKAENGERIDPVFKPEYSPDTLRSFFYMGGMTAVKRELLEELEYCMDQPVLYGGYLPVLEASLRLPLDGAGICHIPRVLYHKTAGNPPMDLSALMEAKTGLMQYYGIEASAEAVEEMQAVRLVYALPDQPKASIIIPSKDNPAMLKVCLDSISRHTRYPNYEVVVIDNGSSEENRAEYEALCQEQNAECRYYYEPMDFNFSVMCNSGAAKATGDYFLFLNDDIEVTEPGNRQTPVSARGGHVFQGHTEKDWLERLMGQASQKHAGAVGAKLLYPGTNKIQHTGVVNYESGAAHIFSKMEDDRPLLQGRNRLDYNYSIVTGACLMVSRRKFQQIGGFEERLAVTFNDVELCFKLLGAGYYNVVRNDVVLYHHESITRGEDALDPAKFLRHLKERETLFSLQPRYVKTDAFYSRHLTQKRLDGSINIERRKEDFPVLKTIGRIGEAGNFPESDLACRIEYVRTGQKIEAGGFAFDKTVRHNNWNKIYLVLKGKEQTLYVKTEKLYDPTTAPQMESSQNLNFTSFYTVFSRDGFLENRYQLGTAVKGIAGKPAKIRMCDSFLAL